jgi:hypothetical protein
MWELCEQNGTRAGFLRELRFPLPVLILPSAAYILITLTSRL